MAEQLNTLSNLTKLAFLCGFAVDSFYYDPTIGVWVYRQDETPNADGEFSIFKWNPFTSNNDAFEMALKLAISIDPYADSVWATCMHNDNFCEKGTIETDIASAARLAICKCGLKVFDARLHP